MLRNAVVFFLSIIAISASLSAQALECTLTVDSAVSSYIKEWTEADAVRLHVRNTKDVPLHFVIETTVALDGHALVTTAHGKRHLLQMQPGEVRVFHCEELLPLRSAYFTDRTRMDRTTGRITVKRGSAHLCGRPRYAYRTKLCQAHVHQAHGRSLHRSRVRVTGPAIGPSRKDSRTDIMEIRRAGTSACGVSGAHLCLRLIAVFGAGCADERGGAGHGHRERHGFFVVAACTTHRHAVCVASVCVRR